MSSSFIIQQKYISMSADKQLKCLVKLNKGGEEKNKILHEENKSENKKDLQKNAKIWLICYG